MCYRFRVVFFFLWCRRFISFFFRVSPAHGTMVWRVELATVWWRVLLPLMKHVLGVPRLLSRGVKRVVLAIAHWHSIMN